MHGGWFRKIRQGCCNWLGVLLLDEGLRFCWDGGLIDRSKSSTVHVVLLLFVGSVVEVLISLLRDASGPKYHGKCALR